MASKWNPFSWGAKDPELITKEIIDPLKKDVATPYSKFLSERIGQRLPQYQGDLSPDRDPMAQKAYEDFMGTDPNEWFSTNIGDPATAKFKSEFLPVLEEGYAGGLRGSGRFKGVEGSINQFSQDLASTRASTTMDIVKTQLGEGTKDWAMRQQQATLEYADWFKSLPENNPLLDKALTFLNSNTGTDVLSALDPGKKGWFSDLLNSAAQVGTAALLVGG